MWERGGDGLIRAAKSDSCDCSCWRVVELAYKSRNQNEEVPLGSTYVSQYCMMPLHAARIRKEQWRVESTLR